MTGDIIDRIDAATGCQQCTGPLGLSPSGDFCSESCQVQWGHERVGATLDPFDGYLQRWMLGVVCSAEQWAYGRVMEVSPALRRHMDAIGVFARRMEQIYSLPEGSLGGPPPVERGDRITITGPEGDGYGVEVTAVRPDGYDVRRVTEEAP